MLQQFSLLAEIFGLFLAIALYCTIIKLVGLIIREKYASSKGNIFLIDVILTWLYASCCGMGIYIFVGLGRNLVVLYAYIIFAIVTIGICFLFFFFDLRKQCNKIYEILFFLYALIILIGTVLGRYNYTDTSIVVVPLHGLQNAILNQNPQYLSHFMLNVFMFLPFGFLISATIPKDKGIFFFAGIGALTLSTSVEWVQLVLSIGQSDIDDVIANTLGSLVGWGGFQFYDNFKSAYKSMHHKTRHNRTSK